MRKIARGEADLILRWFSTDMGAVDSFAGAVSEQLVGATDPHLQLLWVKMARMDCELRA